MLHNIQRDVIKNFFPKTTVELRHLYASLAYMEEGGAQKRLLYAIFMDTGGKKFDSVYRFYPATKAHHKQGQDLKEIELKFSKAFPQGQGRPPQAPTGQDRPPQTYLGPPRPGQTKPDQSWPAMAYMRYNPGTTGLKYIKGQTQPF
eukprot:gene16025-22163_t